MIIRSALVVAFALALAGCAPQTPAPQAPSPSPSQPGAEPAGPVIDVTIAGGTVTPVNADVTAQVDRPITLRVTSDAPDELHVHSVPEHTFEVTATPGQVFAFTVDVPGRVEVELHHLDRTVAIIQVRP